MSFFILFVLFQLIAFPIAIAAFGLFYAKEEGKSRVIGVVIALAGLVITLLLAWLNLALLVERIMAFASLYVAYRKNRRRTGWTISILLLGAPLFLFLLFLPANPPDAASLSLT